MSGKKVKNTKRICKIVYFDEDSVTDYIQIVAGGALEKTTELLKESKNVGDMSTSGKAKVGISGILGALMGFELSATGEGALESSFSSGNMAKNIVKNTILTDFIDIISKNDDDKQNSAISKFEGYSISAPKDSLSYVALISPYLSMIKGGASIPAGEFNIAIDKLDNTIKSAKGYYEFVGNKDDKKVIFRFNIKSFKNNYKAPDLMKMDISIYAIKVGTSSVEKLDFNNEFDIEHSFSTKDNPVYQKEEIVEIDTCANDLLDVYDVLLAGVEINDK